MRAPLRALLAGALVLAGSACATITYDAVTVEGLVAMNRVAPTEAYERVGEFVVERRPIFLIADLITVRDVELEEALAHELARTGGDAVLNLRIEERSDIIDVLIELVQALPGLPALVGTRSVRLRGDVVRWRAQALSGEQRAQLSALCRRIEVLSADQPRTAHACPAGAARAEK